MNSNSVLPFPLAPQWAITAGDLGRFFVWAGVVLFVLTFLGRVFDGRRNWSTFTFVAGCVSLFGAFITLGVLFNQNQFEYNYVFQHSEAGNPFQYKVAAIWSGQQGSFLLWACTSAAFGLITLWSTGIYKRWYVAIYSVFLGSLCGILAYESPFVLELFNGKAYVPPTGAGLTPALQNYWVVIHPPTIFLGFGSLTVLFAYALSALITKDYRDWASRARPWSMVSLALVGVGLCMGGFWAYETLGWGGFWKWDPVENVSFVPWIFVAALVHGLIVQVTKGKWFFGNLLMAGIPFLVFVYGTFLTRAGFLDGVSVHSFAKMDHTAHMVLLWFLIASLLTFFGFWLHRRITDHQPEKPDEPGLTREKFYKLGNGFLLILGAAVAIGMSVPLVQWIAGKQPKVVEEHLYHLVIVWFFVPIMVLVAAGPFVSWRATGWGQLLNRLFTIFCITIGSLGVLMFVMNNSKIGVNPLEGATVLFPFGFKVGAFGWIMTLLGFCLFAAIANIWRIAETWKGSKSSAGAFISHLGVAVALTGLIVSRGLERKQQYLVQDGYPALAWKAPEEPKEASLMPYWMTLDRFDASKIQDKANTVDFKVSDEGHTFLATPGFYMTTPLQGDPEPEVWPYIHRDLSHDLYLELGSPFQDACKPFDISPGQTKLFQVDDLEQHRNVVYTVTYEKPVIEHPGGVGAKFTAYLTVEGPGGKSTVKPDMRITENGPEKDPGVVDNAIWLGLERMDAASHTATIQPNYTRIVFPVDFFYKPLTSLVWLGAGILCFGGLFSAWNRRRIRRVVDAPAEPLGEPSRSEENAVLPVA